ncbi:MAG: putative lipid II flippase FtsW [Sporomusaceae bacterium]|jgi:cell division protein FtsW|nr:putative lipid II flippase FtsW [Sporomusaceae bacterium]
MKRLKKFWLNPSEAIFFLSVILFIIGTVTIFSASFVLGAESFNDSYFFVKRHLASFAVGVPFMYFLTKIDYRRITLPWQMFILFLCLLFLILVDIAGVEVNGAKRWLQLGPVSFQPSEVAKLVVVAISAFYLGEKVDRGKFVSLLSWPIGILFLIGILVLKQPDMGTTVIIAGLGFFLYFLAGIPVKELAVLTVASGPAIFYLVHNAAYRAERIMAWRDPWAYQETSGYQVVQSLLAIGSGGVGGLGLGIGASKFHYLPEAHTDFAFAVLCQELGFVGALLVFILLGLFAWYGLKISLNAPDSHGTILAAGLTVLVVGQAVANIAMVSGIIPVTGVPMPFISFGGTSLIVNMAAVGLLINIGLRSIQKTSREIIAQTAAIRSDKRSQLRLLKK